MLKRLFPFVVWGLFGVSLLGCLEEDEFQNSLRFGTGMSGVGFDLAGEATSFSLTELGDNSLWFRLESEQDMGTRFVRLYFDDVINKDFPRISDYGHIFLSTFSMEYPGTYDVTAYLVEEVIDIGQETFVARSTLTITP